MIEEHRIELLHVPYILVIDQREEPAEVSIRTPHSDYLFHPFYEDAAGIVTIDKEQSLRNASCHPLL